MVRKLLIVFLFLFSTAFFAQNKAIDKLSASPNPFYSSTNISFHSYKRQAVILTVKNVLGKTIFSKRFLTSKKIENVSFNRDNLKAGMYIYTIQNEKEIISKRFVIK